MANGSTKSAPAKATEAPKAEAPKQPDAQTLRRQAYSAANAELREQNKDQFRALVKKHADRLGVTYEFRKTDEEKAAEQLAELVAKYPHLATGLQQPQQQG